MVRTIFFALTVLCSSHMIAEEPWGIDSSLAKKPKASAEPASFSPCLYLIRIHQIFLSEADGPRSHFVPSSSEYVRRAMITWGAGTGYLMGCDRLLRENNERWVYRVTHIRSGWFKWDPVPLKTKDF